MKFFTIAESYPELKADASFSKLSAELVEVVDAIQYSRRYFNGTVRNLNIIIESFPSNLNAYWFGYTTKEYFEVGSVMERDTPIIDIQRSS